MPKADLLDTFAKYLDQIADVGWIYIESKEDVKKLIDLLTILGYESEYWEQEMYNRFFVSLR